MSDVWVCLSVYQSQTRLDSLPSILCRLFHVSQSPWRKFNQKENTHTHTHTQSKPLLSFHLSQETIPAALKASLCVSMQALSNTVTQETSGADKRHDHNAWTWWLWSLSSTSIPQRGKERRERTDEGMSMKGRTEGVVSTWGFSLLSPSSCLLCLCLCGFLYII